MFNTNRRFNRRTATSAGIAILLALASSSALASAMAAPRDDGDADEKPGKAEACAFIGCPGGGRVCGTAAGKISAGMPPFVGEVSVSWTCYEGLAI